MKTHQVESRYQSLTGFTKSTVRRISPLAFWEWCRVRYSALRRMALDLRQTFIFYTPYASWKLFRAVRLVRPRYTMIKPPRLRVLWELSRRVDVENVPGALVECGTWNGGSAAVMVFPQKRPLRRDVWLFDSYEGLPPPTDEDGRYANEEYYYKGRLRADPKLVQEVFQRLDIWSDRVHIRKGWFQDTFPVTPILEIAVLHIDADWYESVKLCLETYYGSVVPGGFVVFDDYGSWEGCKKAVDEFMEAHVIHEPLRTRDGVGFYFRKIKNR